MEIRQVYYVIEVAKHKSSSKAARELYVTQPAISHQINALEDELQLKLFNRDTHSVSLTAEGERFCAYARKIIDAIDDLYSAFDLENSEEKPILKIGVYPFYRSSPLRQILTSFFIANSNVMGNIRVTDNYAAYEMIRSGALDFAIIKARMDNLPDIEGTILEKENLYAVVSRKLPGINSNVMPLADLGKYSLLTGEKDSHFYIEMEKLYRKENIPFKVSFMNTLETNMMQDMVKDGIGIILATEKVARNLEDDDVAALPIEPPQQFATVLLCSSNRKMRGAYLAFRNYVIDSFNNKNNY